jgi:Domain of unknown function (DUF1877)
MSAITEYVRLRPHELTKLRSLLVDDPDEACEYAGDLRMGDEDEEVSSRGTDTDKAWPCLQYLLAKAGAPIDVIGGGEPVTDDVWGYDSPRLLTVDDVVTASRFLDATPFDVLAQHFDPAELASANVQPDIWAEDWALSYLQDCYGNLVWLFHAAATDREPILVWLD